MMGIIREMAAKAGFDGGEGTMFRRGYCDRGRYGVNGELAGIAGADLAPYRAGVAARHAFDQQLADERREKGL